MTRSFDMRVEGRGRFAGLRRFTVVEAGVPASIADELLRELMEHVTARRGGFACGFGTKAGAAGSIVVEVWAILQEDCRRPDGARTSV